MRDDEFIVSSCRRNLQELRYGELQNLIDKTRTKIPYIIFRHSVMLHQRI